MSRCLHVHFDSLLPLFRACLTTVTLVYQKLLMGYAVFDISPELDRTSAESDVLGNWR